jgi:uncharacterized protein YcbX
LSTPRLASIAVYPIRSTAGVALEAARVEPRGLEPDRRSMVVDAREQFVSGHELPALTQIQASVDVTLARPGAAPATIALATPA